MASPPYPYFAEVSGAATSLLIHARRKKARTLLYFVMYRCPITVTRYASMHAMQNVISLLALEKRRLENVQLDIELARLVIIWLVMARLVIICYTNEPES